jgi:LacI family transcriptional regulator
MGYKKPDANGASTFTFEPNLAMTQAMSQMFRIPVLLRPFLKQKQVKKKAKDYLKRLKFINVCGIIILKIQPLEILIEGMKIMVTLKDIAKLAGVSESTVSLCLNDKSTVNYKTCKHVKEIARQLGYTPNAIAKSLAKQRSQTIGLVVPDIENPYFGRLIRCIDEHLTKLQYTLIVATSNDCLSNEHRIIENFISNRVEGVIIAPVNKPVKELNYIQKLNKNEIKYIFSTAYYPNIPASCVMVDLEKGTYDLVGNLISQGHRKIYFLTGDPETIPTSARIKGYEKAFDKHGLVVDKSKFVICSQPNFEQAYVATQSMLKSEKQIDAIITINDIMAMGALRALVENRIKIPEEISLAGYDNVIFSNIATIPITTVHQDIEGIAVTAVDMLINMNSEELSQNKHLLLQPQLVIRESTGPRL